MIRSIIRKVLLEVSYEQVRDLLKKLNERTFENLFGADDRIVIPFKSHALDRIKDMIESNDPNAKVDIDDGTVTTTIETRAGPRERKERVGRVLNKSLKNITKVLHDALEDAGWKKKGDKYFPDNDITKKYVIMRVTRGQYKDENKVTNRPRKPGYLVFGREYANNAEVLIYAGGISMKGLAQIYTWVLNDPARAEYAEILRQEQPIFQSVFSAAQVYKQLKSAMDTYQNEAGGASIVISRAPVDVMRMSDFKNIKSCHSQGSSYFHCAVEEAKGSGLIAWLVPDDELAKVDDLQAQDIFSDSQRGIKGVKPIARVRLRQYRHESGEDLAIPEARLYGNPREGFLEQVVDWARKEQTNLVDRLKEEGYDLGLDEFRREGGSYSDTPAGELLNQFFDTDQYYELDDVESAGNEAMRDQYIQEVDEMIMNLHLPNGDIEFDVDGDLQITWEYESDFAFNIGLRGEIDEEAADKAGIEDEIHTLIDGYVSYQTEVTVDCTYRDGEREIEVEINLKASSFEDHPDDLEHPFSEVDEDDRAIERYGEQEIIKLIRRMEIDILK